MDIYFPNDPPEFSGSPPEVRFQVVVDGVRVCCAVSAEALHDHFDAYGPFEESLIDSFLQGKTRIFSVCRVALERSEGHPVVLRSGLFRFARAAGHS